MILERIGVLYSLLLLLLTTKRVCTRMPMRHLSSITKPSTYPVRAFLFAFQSKEHFTKRLRLSFYLEYVRAIEKHLASSPYQNGPFILGSELTYADLVIFQIYHDEREVGGKINELLDTVAPKLKALVAAVAERPRIKAYFASDRLVTLVRWDSWMISDDHFWSCIGTTTKTHLTKEIIFKRT